MAEYIVAGSEPIATATSMRVDLAFGHPPPVVLRALFVRLPVHAGGALVENLHPVHAAVALPGFGVAREDHRQRDERTAIVRPAREHRVIVERKAFGFDDLLAGAFRDDLRKERADFGQLRQHLEFVEQPFRHAHLEIFADAAGDFVHRVHFERDLHAPHAGEAVDEDRNLRAFRFFEQQRGAAVLDGAVGELGDLEFRIHFEGDAFQFFVFFEGAYEVAQIVVCHVVSQIRSIYYHCKFIWPIGSHS